MSLEERFEQLEKENTELRSRVETLERKGGDIFVTVKDLAEIMKCPANTIYKKIRSGEIFATRKTGGIKIPLSQFHEPQKVVYLPREKKKKEQNRGPVMGGM